MRPLNYFPILFPIWRWTLNDNLHMQCACNMRSHMRVMNASLKVMAIATLLTTITTHKKHGARTFTMPSLPINMRILNAHAVASPHNDHVNREWPFPVERINARDEREKNMETSMQHARRRRRHAGCCCAQQSSERHLRVKYYSILCETECRTHARKLRCARMRQLPFLRNLLQNLSLRRDHTCLLRCVIFITLFSICTWAFCFCARAYVDRPVEFFNASRL